MKNPRFTSQIQTTFSRCIFVAEGRRPPSIILQVEAEVDTTPQPARALRRTAMARAFGVGNGQYDKKRC